MPSSIADSVLTFAGLAARGLVCIRPQRRDLAPGCPFIDYSRFTPGRSAIVPVARLIPVAACGKKPFQ